MIIKVKPVEECNQCVFCDDFIFCSLKGDSLDYDFDNKRYFASFCPLLHPEEPVKSDQVEVITEDLPQIVRCKDCKYQSEPELGYTFGTCQMRSGWSPVNDDWYCADGVRKNI